jgi:signal transduction histidine kinase
MRLADFIVTNTEPILLEWEGFARGTAPGGKMDALALRDHAADILLATARDMRSTQSRSERAARSRGRDRGGDDDLALNEASEQHAIGRLGSGFDLLEVVSEYRALRASVLQLWQDSGREPEIHDIDDLTRFNESIDQSVTRAVSSYTRRLDQSRDLFLAILSHDLRNPLNSIVTSAALLPLLGQPISEALSVFSQIETNAGVMGRMISDLLDYTRTRLGAGMPVSPVAMDLQPLCQDLYNEYRSAFAQRDIRYQFEGDLQGEWDADRLRQAISNLLGNAIQHGADPVELRVTAEPSGVVVVVYNGGPPIPPGEITRIFDPLVRGSSAEHPAKHRPGSIGLGLYIAREVARSHGGSVDATSTHEAGTSFIMRLPRHASARSQPPILDEQHLKTM